MLELLYILDKLIIISIIEIGHHINQRVTVMIIGNKKRLLLGLTLLLFGVAVFLYGMTDDTSVTVDYWYSTVHLVLFVATIVTIATRRSASMHTIDSVLLGTMSVLGMLSVFSMWLLSPDYNYGSSVLLGYTAPLILISLVWIGGSFEKKQIA